MASNEPLSFSNSYVFAATMQSNPGLCRRLVERILGFEILETVSMTVEDTISSAQGKSVRLDVTLRTESRFIDVEIQVQPSKNLGRRMRFYQARADTALLEKGDDFNELPELYIIFICTFDQFGEGLPLYHFDDTCRDRTNVHLGSGIHNIVVNAKDFEACDSEKLRSLLQFIQTDIPDEEDEFIMELERAKNKATATLSVGILADPEMDARVMRKEHIEEGIEIGFAQAQAQQAARIRELREAGASAEEIVSALLQEDES